jgi:hypothetical protein
LSNTCRHTVRVEKEHGTFTGFRNPDDSDDGKGGRDTFATGKAGMRRVEDLSQTVGGEIAAVSGPIQSKNEMEGS